MLQLFLKHGLVIRFAGRNAVLGKLPQDINSGKLGVLGAGVEWRTSVNTGLLT